LGDTDNPAGRDAAERLLRTIGTENAPKRIPTAPTRGSIQLVCSFEETPMANRGKNQKKPKGYNKKVPVVVVNPSNAGKPCNKARGKKK
jgi:hypothetical protein